MNAYTIVLLGLAFVFTVAAEFSQVILVPESCCSRLSTVLGDKVSFPNEAAYNVSLASYWSQQEQEVAPNCVVRPKSTGDVSTAIKCLTQGAKEHLPSCQFAIKGGGHMMWAGAANIAAGVTIDLAAMSDVSVNAARTLTSVAAGAVWLDEYSHLDALGLAVSGGRDSNVGVAGLTLGGAMRAGGLSYFAPRFGFVCDNVLNYEVVLASGEVVNANASSRSDLFFALKGVVTRFDFRTFTQNNIWGGSVGYDISTKDQQLEAFSHFADANNDDPYAALIHAYAWIEGHDEWLISNTYAYTKPEPYPDIFGTFTSIEPQIHNQVRITTMTSLAIEMDGSNPSGDRQVYVTVTVANNIALLSKVFEIVDTLLEPLKTRSGLRYALAYQAVPTCTMSRSLTSGGNALGLDPGDGNLVLIFLDISWKKATDEEVMNRQARSFVKQVEMLAASSDMLHRWRYLNYAAQWQNPIGSYGYGDREKLRAASREYDPDQVFQKQVPGGYKLF
ncbi:hypothetical protein MMC26_004870 [Xylographa opegraphella]|nr:hypothetical protein [Xylographa opegraphella]